MGGPQAARRSLAIAALAMLLGVAGCAGNAGGAGDAGGAGNLGELGDAGSLSSDGAAVSEQDANAIGQLVEIAARDAKPEGPVGSTECWAPSQNPVSEGEFRVICRVHFEQQGAERYRDMICIGNLGRDPVADYCYQWAYYADAPKFEDRPAFAASSSR